MKAKLENPNLLQAPLYMMAAQHLNVRPAGMFYLGVKGGIEYAGWSETGLMESLALPENWLETTRDNTLRIVDDIRARTHRSPRPPTATSCRFCDFATSAACRRGRGRRAAEGA